MALPKLRPVTAEARVRPQVSPHEILAAKKWHWDRLFSEFYSGNVTPTCCVLKFHSSAPDVIWFQQFSLSQFLSTFIWYFGNNISWCFFAFFWDAMLCSGWLDMLAFWK
jgi:hypothetical protein